MLSIIGPSSQFILLRKRVTALVMRHSVPVMGIANTSIRQVPEKAARCIFVAKNIEKPVPSPVTQADPTGGKAPEPTSPGSVPPEKPKPGSKPDASASGTHSEEVARGSEPPDSLAGKPATQALRRKLFGSRTVSNLRAFFLIIAGVLAVIALFWFTSREAYWTSLFKLRPFKENTPAAMEKLRHYDMKEKELTMSIAFLDSQLNELRGLAPFMAAAEEKKATDQEKASSDSSQEQPSGSSEDYFARIDTFYSRLPLEDRQYRQFPSEKDNSISIIDPQVKVRHIITRGSIDSPIREIFISDINELVKGRIESAEPDCFWLARRQEIHLRTEVVSPKSSNGPPDLQNKLEPAKTYTNTNGSDKDKTPYKPVNKESFNKEVGDILRRDAIVIIKKKTELTAEYEKVKNENEELMLRISSSDSAFWSAAVQRIGMTFLAVAIIVFLFKVASHDLASVRNMDRFAYLYELNPNDESLKQLVAKYYFYVQKSVKDDGPDIVTPHETLQTLLQAVLTLLKKDTEKGSLPTGD
jgi:hypothetical protein